MQGMTLLEVLLALAIGASIIMFGFQQYSNWQRATNVEALNANIDAIFSAAAQFYEANCGKAGSILTGDANVNNIQPISLSDLQTNGYLPANAVLPNPLADVNAYVVQFNPHLSSRIFQFANFIDTLIGPGPQTIGTIVSWSIQVSVLLNDASQRDFVKNSLQATCSTNLNGSTTTPCRDPSIFGPQAGNYVSFERFPYYVLSSSGSNYRPSMWQTKPLLLQFQQMYTVYPMTYLLGAPPDQRYFYCN